MLKTRTGKSELSSILGDEGTQRRGEFDRVHIQEVALEEFEIPSLIPQVDLQTSGEKR